MSPYQYLCLARPRAGFLCLCHPFGGPILALSACAEQATSLLDCHQLLVEIYSLPDAFFFLSLVLSNPVAIYSFSLFYIDIHARRINV